MADPFLAEIRIFCGNFAPTGWATCDGQLMPISQNTALFSLLGTMYGGDGRSTFGLPRLSGSSPMHRGQGPGLSDRFQGEQAGEVAVSLTTQEIPPHTHQFSCSTANGADLAGNGEYLSKAGLRGRSAPIYGAVANTTMAPTALGVAGGSIPHNNMPPYLVLTFIIALQGIFPPRS